MKISTGTALPAQCLTQISLGVLTWLEADSLKESVFVCSAVGLCLETATSAGQR